jgi:hypothetical protein
MSTSRAKQKEKPVPKQQNGKKRTNTQMKNQISEIENELFEGQYQKKLIKKQKCNLSFKLNLKKQNIEQILTNNNNNNIPPLENRNGIHAKLGK